MEQWLPPQFALPLVRTHLQGWDGKKSDFGNAPTEGLYGPQGWCEADEPEFRCPCLRVGSRGGVGSASGHGWAGGGARQQWRQWLALMACSWLPRG